MDPEGFGAPDEAEESVFMVIMLSVRKSVIGIALVKKWTDVAGWVVCQNGSGG